MELSDKAAAVSRMQAYIVEHIADDITLDALCGAAGYSKYHAARVFKELTGRTPFETIRALRLTKAAQTLRDTEAKVVDAALDSGFDSHDGFTRAFARRFGVTPRRYSAETPPVPYFVHYPIEAYYMLKEGAEPMPNEKVSRTVTVTAVERPARKLILLRSVKATEYFSYCEEMGCDWEGLFNSIPEKFAPAALLTLPPNLMTPGTGSIASGTEVPLDYQKPVPDGYDVIELPPCTMLYFQGASYEDENDFCTAIGTLWEVMDAYDPTLYGWRYAPELAPYFNFGADAKTGARMARSVEKM
ncbi:MAG: AraC family transcriptional regulator [Oscillospiraceae bacterium]|nr:AraC family transcriptional regulator [Oscillospiraceae bacterium]